MINSVKIHHMGPGYDRDEILAKGMFLSILPGQILAMAIIAITPTINTFVIGNYVGAQGLSAVAFIFPLNFIISMLQNVISQGSVVRCGTYLGSGNKDGLNTVFSVGIMVCIGIGLIFTGVVLFFAPALAYVFGATVPENNLITSEYLRGMGIGITFTILSASVLKYMQLDNAKKTTYAATILMIVTTVSLDFIFTIIFDLGMFGIGLASSCGHFSVVLLGIFHYFSKNCSFKLRFKGNIKSEILGILKAGSPRCYRDICKTIRSLIVNNIINTLGGSGAMACMGVYCNISTLCYILPDGINSSASTIASVFAGERDESALRDMAKFANRLSLVVYLVEYALVIIFARHFAVLFGIEPELIALCAHVIIIASLGLMGDMLSYTNLGIYQGIGNTKIVSLANFLNTGAVSYILLLILPMLIGLDGVWVMFASVSFVPFFLLLAYSVRKQKRLPKGLTDFVYIPEEIKADPKDCFYITISEMEEICEASISITEFLKNKNAPDKKCMYTGLCLEEISRNIMGHGFKKRSWKNRIDVCAIYEKERISLLIRDNGKPFDPTKWMEIYDMTDPTSNIGIKLVSKISEKMEYQSTLGLNVLWVYI